MTRNNQASAKHANKVQKETKEPMIKPKNAHPLPRLKESLFISRNALMAKKTAIGPAIVKNYENIDNKEISPMQPAKSAFRE